MMRYKKHPWRAIADLPGRATRERIDPRRFNAARRALESKREKEGLFGGAAVTDDEIVARLKGIEASDGPALRNERHKRARGWVVARRALRALPVDIRNELLWRWNKGNTPAEPWYLASTIHSTCHPKACAILAEERTDPWLDLHASPFVIAQVAPEVLASLARGKELAREQLDTVAAR